MALHRHLLIAVLLSLFCASLEATATPLKLNCPCQSDLTQEVLHYARAYRKDTTLAKKQEQKRQEKILEEVFARLPTYNSFDSLEHAVCGFLADALSFLPHDYRVVDAGRTSFAGRSNDRVFLIYDPDNRLCFALKAFRNPRDSDSKFIPEISALDFIEQLSLPGVAPVKPIAFGSFSASQREWGLLLETAAGGERLDQFVFQLGAKEIGSIARKTLFDRCEKALRRTAESLAWLHSRQSSRQYPIPSNDLSAYDKKLAKILNNPFILEEIEKWIPVQDFINYARRIKGEAMAATVRYCYWHGDANLANMFYDSAADAIYFIDVHRLHYSLDIREEPLLVGTIDLVHVEDHLLSTVAGNLEEWEYNALASSFYESYELCSGQKIPEPILSYYRTYFKLTRLIYFSNYKDKKDPFRQLSDKHCFELAIKYFADRIGT